MLVAVLYLQPCIQTANSISGAAASANGAHVCASSRKSIVQQRISYGSQTNQSQQSTTPSARQPVGISDGLYNSVHEIDAGLRVHAHLFFVDARPIRPSCSSRADMHDAGGPWLRRYSCDALHWQAEGASLEAGIQCAIVLKLGQHQLHMCPYDEHASQSTCRERGLIAACPACGEAACSVTML